MVYIALFALGAALVTLFFYLILNPRVLTTEGETFDLRFVLFMLRRILLAAGTVALMLLIGKAHHLLSGILEARAWASSRAFWGGTFPFKAFSKASSRGGAQRRRGASWCHGARRGFWPRRRRPTSSLRQASWASRFRGR